MTINFREVQKLRKGDPTEAELRDFFRRREAFFRAHKGPIRDYLDYSPMYLCDRWTEDPGSEEQQVSDAEAKKIRRNNRRIRKEQQQR